MSTMRYCFAAEDQQVGGKSRETIMATPSGFNLRRLHAVELLVNGPASRTVCGQTYDRLQQDADWEDPRNRMGGNLCSRCDEMTARLPADQA